MTLVGVARAPSKNEGCELIELAKEVRLDHLQFFGWEPTLLKEWVYYGKSVGVSVVGSFAHALDLVFLRTLSPPYYKFERSFSQEKEMMRGLTQTGLQVVVSTAFEKGTYPGVIRLLEVGETPFLMNFNGLFPGRFQGFSDFSPGWEETDRAIKAGAVWIERQVTLESLQEGAWLSLTRKDFP